VIGDEFEIFDFVFGAEIDSLVEAQIAQSPGLHAEFKIFSADRRNQKAGNKNCGAFRQKRFHNVRVQRRPLKTNSALRQCPFAVLTGQTHLNERAIRKAEVSQSSVEPSLAQFGSPTAHLQLSWMLLMANIQLTWLS
jgi:hypothetical protein